MDGEREGEGGVALVDKKKASIKLSFNHSIKLSLDNQYLVKLYVLVLDMDSSLEMVRLLSKMEVEGEGRGRKGEEGGSKGREGGERCNSRDF